MNQQALDIFALVRSNIDLSSKNQGQHWYRLGNKGLTNEHVNALLAQINKIEEEVDQQSFLALNLKNNNCIGDTICLRLPLIPLVNLRWLNLNNTYLGNTGCKHLSKVNCHNLNRLYLEQNHIEYIGCRHLSKGRWPLLKALSLRCNRIGERGYKHITNGNWPALVQLNLSMEYKNQQIIIVRSVEASIQRKGDGIYSGSSQVPISGSHIYKISQLNNAISHLFDSENHIYSLLAIELYNYLALMKQFKVSIGQFEGLFKLEDGALLISLRSDKANTLLLARYTHDSIPQKLHNVVNSPTELFSVIESIRQTGLRVSKACELILLISIANIKKQYVLPLEKAVISIEDELRTENQRLRNEMKQLKQQHKKEMKMIHEEKDRLRQQVIACLNDLQRQRERCQYLEQRIKKVESCENKSLANKLKYVKSEEKPAKLENQTETQHSDLQVISIKPGNGKQPSKGSKITCHYVGTFPDGKKFDSSRDKGKTFEFTLGMGQVIKGWDQGIIQMSQGQIANIICPPEFAYGKQGVSSIIPPNATLCFEVELISWR